MEIFHITCAEWDFPFSFSQSDLKIPQLFRVDLWGVEITKGWEGGIHSASTWLFHCQTQLDTISLTLATASTSSIIDFLCAFQECWFPWWLEATLVKLLFSVSWEKESTFGVSHNSCLVEWDKSKRQQKWVFWGLKAFFRIEKTNGVL